MMFGVHITKSSYVVFQLKHLFSINNYIYFVVSPIM